MVTPGRAALPERLALAALVSVALAVVAGTLLLRLPAEISLNYGEGFVQLDVLRLARGEPLFGDPARPPWTVQTYTPLYLAAVSLFARLGAEGYGPGRWLGYGAVLASAVLLVWAGRPRSGASAWGVAALYLTLPIFISWGAVVRPDNWAVFFSLAGVVWTERHAGRRALWAALPLFLAAGMAKQSSAAAPLAAFLWLALRDRRRALVFAAALGLAVGLCVAALQWGSGGWFWLHAVGSHAAKPWSSAQWVGVFQAFFAFHALPLLAGLGLVVGLLLRRRFSLPLLWLALAALASLSAGKSGSDTNYFLEPMAALALLAARELPPPLGGSSWRRAAAVAAASGLALYHLFLLYANSDWIPRAERDFARVVSTYEDLRAPVISDDAGFLLAGDRPLWLRPFIVTQLAEAGLWDEAPLLRALEAGDFALVIVQRQPAPVFHSRYTPAMRRALARRYRRIDAYRTDFEYEVLAPR